MSRLYFPLFMDISDQKIVVVGGGRVAQRRIETLLAFAPDLWVAAPEVTDRLRELAEEERIHWLEEAYSEKLFEKLPDMKILLAATDDPECNKAAAKAARKRGILANTAHKKELCDFFFPAVARKEEVVAGICASGLSHKKARRAREAVEQALENLDREIIIGSRRSRLALIQTELVADQIREAFPEARVQIRKIETTGDRRQDLSLDQMGGKGVFIKELDRALLEGKIDLAVHSLKDMPMEVADGLQMAAFSSRADARDVLVLPKGRREWEGTGVIGCSSFRRRLQAQRLFPQAQFQNIRGNVLTRLDKLDRGEYDALILAAAGLRRLGLEGRIFRYFSTDEILPAAGQGTLALTVRAGEAAELLEACTSRETTAVAEAERAFVRVLGGGCSSPVAAYGECRGAKLTLKGLYYDEGSKAWWIGKKTGELAEAEGLGRRLAQEMRTQNQARREER